MEELFFTPETRLGMTLRINSEITNVFTDVYTQNYIRNILREGHLKLDPLHAYLEKQLQAL